MGGDDGKEDRTRQGYIVRGDEIPRLDGECVIRLAGVSHVNRKSDVTVNRESVE